jgi:hypothetical protein
MGENGPAKDETGTTPRHLSPSIHGRFQDRRDRAPIHARFPRAIGTDRTVRATAARSRAGPGPRLSRQQPCPGATKEASAFSRVAYRRIKEGLWPLPSGIECREERELGVLPVLGE